MRDGTTIYYKDRARARPSRFRTGGHPLRVKTAANPEGIPIAVCTGTSCACLHASRLKWLFGRLHARAADGLLLVAVFNEPEETSPSAQTVTDSSGSRGLAILPVPHCVGISLTSGEGGRSGFRVSGASIEPSAGRYSETCHQNNRRDK